MMVLQHRRRKSSTRHKNARLLDSTEAALSSGNEDSDEDENENEEPEGLASLFVEVNEKAREVLGLPRAQARLSMDFLQPTLVGVVCTHVRWCVCVCGDVCVCACVANRSLARERWFSAEAGRRGGSGRTSPPSPSRPFPRPHPSSYPRTTIARRPKNSHHPRRRPLPRVHPSSGTRPAWRSWSARSPMCDDSSPRSVRTFLKNDFVLYLSLNLSLSH
jgi:hypothetical protein